VLIILVSYAFISHTLKQRRIQRQRLISALKVRERNFKYMVTGFPPSFLPYDLAALVYRALIDTCDELTRLSPDNAVYKTDTGLYRTELNSLQKTEATRVRLENPAQIKEVRQHLQELHRFILAQEASRQLNPVQASVLNDQIKRLSLQTAIDGYMLQARQAQQVGKHRLAIHHLLLAKKALEAENTGHQYDKQIGKIATAIQGLEQKASPHSSVDDESISESAEGTPVISKEWEQFETDETWKKKQIYD